jgi:hypothetical protein
VNKTTPGHHLRTTVMIALLAMLLLALVVEASSATTSSDRDGNGGIQAMDANSLGAARQSCWWGYKS